MKTSLQENISAIKRKLSAEDILVHSFTAGNGVACAIVYADGIVDKELLGRLVVEPLAAYRQNAAAKEMLKAIAYPELKTETAQEAICAAVLDGNPALFLDGADFAAVVGRMTSIFLRSTFSCSESAPFSGNPDSVIPIVPVSFP